MEKHADKLLVGFVVLVFACLAALLIYASGYVGPMRDREFHLKMQERGM